MKPVIPPSMGLMPRSLYWMERNQLSDILIKDLLGFNMPRMTVAAMRSTGDFLDTTRMELSNTSVTVLGSLTVPFFMRHLAAMVSGMPQKTLKKLGHDATLRKTATAAQKMGHLAGSLGFLVPFAFAFASTPYLRNWITLKQAGTANFEEIIGLGKSPKGHHNDRSYKEELAFQLGKVRDLNLIGVGLGAVTTILLGLKARNLAAKSRKAGAKVAHKTINKLFNAFHLSGNNANQITGDLSVFIWWLLPAYTGYILASRGKHERRENIIKTVNSLLWFTIFNRIFTKPHFGKLFRTAQKRLGVTLAKGPTLFKNTAGARKKGLAKLGAWVKHQSQLPKWVPGWQAIANLEKTNPNAYHHLARLRTNRDLSLLAISIVMLATTPAVLNVILTRARVKAERKHYALHNGLQAINRGLLPVNNPYTGIPINTA